MDYTVTRLHKFSLAAFLLLGLTLNAQALPNLTGYWQGEWATTDGSIYATFDMKIHQHHLSGEFTGWFDWTCVSGITCYGIETFAGSVNAALDVYFATTGIFDAMNLGSAEYFAISFPDGKLLFGTSTGDGVWYATKVPEPTTVTLFGLALIGLGLSRRFALNH